MNRSRSPQYPSLSLPQAIEMVTKLHKANRTSIISRETAAKDMGYTGLTGRSLTVIAALAQFGLIEKAGKGDIKVTRRAVDILHSVEQADRDEAVREAAMAPALFQQLVERFPEGVPSQNALRSYLIQQEFGDVAIGPAITAFLETIAFAEKAKDSERNGEGSGEGAGSAQPTEEKPVQTPAVTPTPTPTPPAPEGSGRTLISNRRIVHNEAYLDFRGSHEVHIEGIFDLNGILELEDKLKAVKMLLKAPLAPMAAGEAEDQTSH